jgi:hypothetical protein
MINSEVGQNPAIRQCHRQISHNPNVTGRSTHVKKRAASDDTARSSFIRTKYRDPQSGTAISAPISFPDHWQRSWHPKSPNGRFGNQTGQ